MKKMLKSVVAGTSLFIVITNAAASDFRYGAIGLYREDGEIETSGSALDAELWGFWGTAEVGKNFFIQGELADGEVESTIDLEAWRVAIGAHFPVAHNIDIVTALGHSEVELSLGSYSDTETGEDGLIGVRAELIPKIEVNVDYNYDFDNDDGYFSGELYFDITQSVTLSVGYAKDEDWSSRQIGVHYYY